MTKHLTKAQSAFAEQNYGLLIAFLAQQKLDWDTFYGPVAERYLASAVQYYETPALHRYAFSTIAWRQMRLEVSHVIRSQMARPPTVEQDVYSLPAVDDLTQAEVEAAWKEMARRLSEKELQVLKFRQVGLSYREIANKCECSENAVKCRFRHLRKSLNKLLDYHEGE
jgi:RNA polymerase sigma-70 factor (ECF subfamily)